MTLVIFLIVKSTIDVIKEKSRVYFTLKLQEYEESKKGENEVVLPKTKEETKKDYNDSNSNNTLVYIESSNDYELEDIFELTKLIDKDFTLNNEDIIKKFISEHITNNSMDIYNSLIKIKDKIDDFGIYKLMTSDEDEINSFVDSIKDDDVVKKYFLTNNVFDINDFISYINTEIDKNNPTIYILVGQKFENYDKIDSRIKTIYNDTIYKGFKIIYKNKMYDYSLD